MKIRQGAKVVHNGESVGEVIRVVLDPRTKSAVAVVVQRGFVLPERKVVYMDEIESADDEQVTLKSDVNFDQLNDFEEVEFIDLNNTEKDRTGYGENLVTPTYWYPPLAYGPMTTPLYMPNNVEISENIPKGTVALVEGANVYSSDNEHVGDVERVSVDTETGEVTHFLISRGVLFKEHKRIPAWWIENLSENRVNLSVSKDMLERLPDYKEE